MSAALIEEMNRRARQDALIQAGAAGPFSGEIVIGSVDQGDRVWVKVNAINPLVRVGPCRWHSRDGVQLPQRGDKCLVHFSETGEAWVTTWWPLNLDIVAAARRALNQKSHYHYATGVPPQPPARPYPNSLWVAAPVYIDCSSFATLCFKAAHCLDPNRSDYDGQGFTGTLFANGTPTTTPRPGDLAFYGVDADDPTAPDHVTVCIGNDNCISMGEEGDPTLKPVDYRTDAIPGGGAAPYFMTYVLA